MTILVQDEPGTSLGPASGRQERGRWSLSLLVSAAIHGLLLTALCWRAAPVLVRPLFLARGQGGTAAPVSVALSWPKAAVAPARVSPPLVSLPAPARAQQKATSKLRKRSNLLDSSKPADSREAGSVHGSSLDGATEGDEIKPGFAVSFSPPHVSRWELPGGKDGDVVVELTIDEQGNVVAEKLLQGIGHGIDERVIGALRVWRFRPATRNGVAIPFKYDARFHFPS